jgi:hypothetical protein
MPVDVAHRSRNNEELNKINTTLCQLADRYHHARKENGSPVLSRIDLDQCAAALGQSELQVARLHLLASTAAAMIDEAATALGLPLTKRPFEVLSDNAIDAAPSANGHALVPDVEELATR